MKLRKIVKHIDMFCDVILKEDCGEIVFTHFNGDMLDLQAAADIREDKEQYLKELEEDGEIERLGKILMAEKYLDWKLDTNDNCEAISFTIRKNDKGVDVPLVEIYIRK